MKAFNGYKAEPSNKVESLPAGPYVTEILRARIVGQEPDETLIIRVDIKEGPYMRYFRDRYDKEVNKAAGKYEPKYKGDFRIRIPNDDNKKAMYPESDKKRFSDAMYRIEQSNPGYRWEWTQDSVDGLQGLTVGINMQQDEYNGIPFTKIGRLEIADDVRNGSVSAMPPKRRAEQQVDQQTGFAQVDEEPPF